MMKFPAGFHWVFVGSVVLTCLGGVCALAAEQDVCTEASSSESGLGGTTILDVEYGCPSTSARANTGEDLPSHDPPQTKEVVEATTGKRDWWQEIRAAAGHCFKDQFQVKILYSAKLRQVVRDEQLAFVKAASAVLKERETALRQLAARRKMAEMLQGLLLQDGLRGIQEHFKLVDEVAEREASIVAAEQLLTSFIETCKPATLTRTEQ